MTPDSYTQRLRIECALRRQSGARNGCRSRATLCCTGAITASILMHVRRHRRWSDSYWLVRSLWSSRSRLKMCRPKPRMTRRMSSTRPERSSRPKRSLRDKPRTPLYRNYLPPFVDHTDRFPRPRHQGEQGSCVGWAVGYAARSYYNTAPGGGPHLRSHQIPSPAYIYDSIRRPDESCDDGSRIIDALGLLKKGAVTYAEYPYNEGSCRRPGAQMVARASKFRIADWRVVDTDQLDQVKAELASGHPVVIGMRPNRDFHRLRGREVWRAGMPGRRRRTSCGGPSSDIPSVASTSC